MGNVFLRRMSVGVFMNEKSVVKGERVKAEINGVKAYSKGRQYPLKYVIWKAFKGKGRNLRVEGVKNKERIGLMSREKYFQLESKSMHSTLNADIGKLNIEFILQGFC